MEDNKNTQSDITLNTDGTANFYLTYESETLGTVTGPFVFKCQLSPLEFLSIGREHRNLLGANVKDVSETEYAIGLYLSQLKTRIIKSPPFWTSAPNYPGNINDFNLISFIFEKALSAEILYKDQLKKKREEALQTAQNAVKLIKARANPDPKE